MAIDELNQKRLYSIPFTKNVYSIDVPNFKVVEKKSLLISDIKDYEVCDEVYVDNIDLFNQLDNPTLKLERVLEHLPDYHQRLLVGELGSVYKYQKVFPQQALY